MDSAKPSRPSRAFRTDQRPTTPARADAGPARARPVPDPDADPGLDPALGAEHGPVEIRRSRKRRRTVQAYREGSTTIVLMPAGLSAAEEQRWVRTMVERLDAKYVVRRPSDSQLAERAGELSERYLGGRARPSSVQWSDRQQKRWGSCSVHEGSIRLSRRLFGLPEWVIDYVLLHELAHLLVPDHSARFWALLKPYPLAERAKGFLEGVTAVDATAPRSEG